MSDQIILSPVPLADLKNHTGMDNPFAVIERRMNRNEVLLDQVLECLKDIKKKQPEEQLISSEEACNIFKPKITRPTLQAWTDQGLLKSYRLGGRVWYKHSEIIAAAGEIKRYKKTGEQAPAAQNHRAVPAMIQS